MRDYWGYDPTEVPDPDGAPDDGAPDDGAQLEAIKVSTLPSAMVRSLGRPPLPGQDQAAEAYFDVVYAKAALLASALADSVGLLDDAGDEDA